MQQELVRRLSKLTQAAQAMTRCQEVGELLDTILRLVEEVFHLDTCAVLLLDKATGALRIERARGYDPHVLETFEGAVGRGITGRAVRDGKLTFVPDVQADPDYVGGVTGAVSESPYRCGSTARSSGCSTPRSASGPTSGATRSRSSRPSRTTRRSPSRTPGSTTNLARRTAQAEQQVRRLKLLGEAAAALSSSLDLDVVLVTILSLLHQALEFDQCAVLLLDASDTELRVRAAMGYEQSIKYSRIPVGEGVTGEVARTGKPVLVADVTRHTSYIPGVRGGKCEMAAPLVTRGKTIGVLDAESTTRGAFSQADLDLFATFALHAATALANAETCRDLESANDKLDRNFIEMERMNRELTEHARAINVVNAKLEHRVHELLTLQEAQKTITSSLDLDETLQAIVRMTREIIHSSMSAIKLVDEESKEMSVRVHESDDQPGATPLVREVLGVPLRIGDRAIGDFEVSRTDEKEFTDGERRLLETLASQAAIAIENARLFEDTQRTLLRDDPLARACAGGARLVHQGALGARDALRAADRGGHGDLATERKIIGHASLLHDIGKIGIADAILNRPCR